MQKDQVLFPPVDLDNLSPRASPLYPSTACYCSDNLAQNSKVRELFMHVVQFKGTRHWKTALLINGLWALVRTVLIHHFAKWMCEVTGYKLEDMLACLCSQHSVYNKPLPIPPFSLSAERTAVEFTQENACPAQLGVCSTIRPQWLLRYKAICHFLVVANNNFPLFSCFLTFSCFLLDHQQKSKFHQRMCHIILFSLLALFKLLCTVPKCSVGPWWIKVASVLWAFASIMYFFCGTCAKGFPCLNSFNLRTQSWNVSTLWMKYIFDELQEYLCHCHSNRSLEI